MPDAEEHKAQLAAVVSGSKELQKMYRYIDDNNVWWYSDFVDHCMDNEPEWFELLAKRYSRAVSRYIKNRAMRISKARRKKMKNIEIQKFKYLKLRKEINHGEAEYHDGQAGRTERQAQGRAGGYSE